MSDQPTTPNSNPSFTEPAHCETCGALFESTVFVMLDREFRWQRNCPKCSALREAEMKMREEAQNKEAIFTNQRKWADLCDSEYRTVEEGGFTDPERLQQDCSKLDQIIAHNASVGLLIRGRTGLCKTRAMWRLLRRLFDDRRKIIALSAGDFRRQYSRAAGTDFNEAQWFDKLVEADIFFLDDLGKAQWTDGVWGCFFELVESRTKKNRPIFITTNDTAETLATKCKDQATWEPLERRLRQHCHRITL